MIYQSFDKRVASPELGNHNIDPVGNVGKIAGYLSAPKPKTKADSVQMIWGILKVVMPKTSFLKSPL